LFGPVGHFGEVVQAVGVYNDWQVLLGDQDFEEGFYVTGDTDARAEREAIVLLGEVEQDSGGFCGYSACVVFGQRGCSKARLDGGYHGQYTFWYRDPYQPGTGAQGGSAHQGGGTAHTEASGDDAYFAEVSFMAIGGSGF